VVLMAKAGDGLPASGLRLTFDQSAADSLPNGQLTSGTYKPTDNNPLDAYPAPAPAGPYANSLDSLVGKAANGSYELYIYDDLSPDGGAIVGGWQLSVETYGPSISQVTPVTTTQNTPVSVVFPINSTNTMSNVTVTATSSGEIPAGLVQSLALSGTGNYRTLTITPGENLPSMVTNIDGTATITVKVNDKGGENTMSFPFTVLYENMGPIISGLSNTNTPANISLAVPFTVTDVEGGTVFVSGGTSTPDLGTAVVTGKGNNYVLTFTPSGKLGTAKVTVDATDGTLSSSRTIDIVVQTALPPIITGLQDMSVPQDSGLIIVNFNITRSTPSVVVTATTDQPQQFTSLSVFGTGENWSLFITPKPGAYSPPVATISVVAAETYGATTNSFTFTINRVYAPPVIAPINPQKTLVNVPAVVPVTVTDKDTPVADLQFTGTSTNAALVSGVTFLNDGSNVVATVHVVKDATGVDLVTISAFDGTNTTKQSFTLSVVTPLSFGPIQAQSTYMNIPVTIPLDVKSGTKPLNDLTYGWSSEDTTIISNVTFDAKSDSVTATVTPVHNAVGVGTVTLTVSDGVTTLRQSFNLAVSKPIAPTLQIAKVDNTVVLSFTGTPNYPYVLQASENLAAWQDAGVITTDANGFGSYTVDLAKSPSILFGRVVAK